MTVRETGLGINFIIKCSCVNVQRRKKLQERKLIITHKEGRRSQKKYIQQMQHGVNLETDKERIER